MTAAIIALAVGFAVACTAIVLLVRAYTALGPKLVAASEQVAAHTLALAIVTDERNAALATAAEQRALAAAALARLSAAEDRLRQMREEEAEYAVTKIRSAATATAALDALNELLSTGPRLDLPGASGVAPEGDRPAEAAVPLADVAEPAADGRGPTG